MIITKEIKIIATGKLLSHLREKGYDIKSHQELTICVSDLPKNTRKKITAKCDKCGKVYDVMYKNYLQSLGNGNYFTCNECKGQKIKMTCNEKYGVDNVSQLKNVKDKKKETLYTNYNTYNILDLSKETIKEKYGVDNVFQSEIIKEKIKKTNLEKYGVENPQQSKIIQLKSSQKIYGGLKIIDLNFSEKNYTILCDKCGNTYKIGFDLLNKRIKIHKTEPCLICNPLHTQKSDKENRLYKFIKDNYNGEIISSDREILKPQELDIYLPELKLAFEFNGVYWHNELYKEKNYHLEKTKKCEEQDIQLVHIWEDDWNYKQEIIKSMILNKIGVTHNKIYGRKTEIKEINDNKLIREFLDKNHLQGFVGSKIKIGLFYENELVSLMTFGKKRLFMNSNSKDGEYELLRFCNKLNTNVIGGASKLFNYFIKNYKPKEIITYANRSHSQGNLYEKLGFEFVSKTLPNYYYVIDGIRKYRFGFRKDVLIKEGYDKNMTEHEIMNSRNIYRIYDSGSLKYIYSI